MVLLKRGKKMHPFLFDSRFFSYFCNVKKIRLKNDLICMALFTGLVLWERTVRIFDVCGKMCFTFSRFSYVLSSAFFIGMQF
jgi:hypothetical protein